MLFFHGFSSSNKRTNTRSKRNVGLRLTAIVAMFGIGLVVSSIGVQANAKAKAKHQHSQMTEPTAEQREAMALALEKKAKCLRSATTPASKCHEEMKASCDGGHACGAHHENGAGTCPMMEETKTQESK